MEATPPGVSVICRCHKFTDKILRRGDLNISISQDVSFYKVTYQEMAEFKNDRSTKLSY